MVQASLAAAQYRFSSIHDKRVDLIPELHYWLEKVQSYALAIHGAQKQEQPVSDEYLDLAFEDTRSLLDSYMKTKLYLDEELARRVAEIASQLSRPILALKWSQSDDDKTRMYGLFLGLGWEKIAEEIPSLLKDLGA